jgi:hypothetical protein
MTRLYNVRKVLLLDIPAASRMTPLYNVRKVLLLDRTVSTDMTAYLFHIPVIVGLGMVMVIMCGPP